MVIKTRKLWGRMRPINYLMRGVAWLLIFITLGDDGGVHLIPAVIVMSFPQIRTALILVAEFTE